MSKYLKKFETVADYTAFIATDYVKPNVSYIVEGNGVEYNPIVPLETRLVCKYNVENTSSPTALRSNYEQNIFKSMEIDGVMLDGLVTEYTFDSVGVHTVKYELYDETKLGNNAPVFNNGNLIEATIPNSVTSIGNSAFAECSGLTSCTIGSGVTTIGNNAFYNCYKLTSIDIPNSVTSIGNSTFNYCSGLTSIDIPNSVTSIGGNAFQYCIRLTSCTIGSGVTSIGQSAFSFCTGLTSIDIPNSVTTIGREAFAACTGLTSCTIGSSVTSIGNNAFNGCSGLTSITSLATTAPTIQSNTFRSVKTNGTLYVPQGSSGYDTWMQNANYYLGLYNWTMVEQ